MFQPMYWVFRAVIQHIRHTNHLEGPGSLSCLDSAQVDGGRTFAAVLRSYGSRIGGRPFPAVIFSGLRNAASTQTLPRLGNDEGSV